MIGEVDFLLALDEYVEPHLPPYPEVPGLPGVSAMPTRLVDYLALEATNMTLAPVLRDMNVALNGSSWFKVRSLFRAFVIHLCFISHKLWLIKFGLKGCSGNFELGMICIEEIVSTVMRFSQGLLDEGRNLERHLTYPMFTPLGRPIKPEASFALLHHVRKAFDAQHRCGHYDGAIPASVNEADAPEKRYMHETNTQLAVLAGNLEVMHDLLIKACKYLWGDFSVQSN